MQITIVGAGTTGTEIAQALALSGNPITLHDRVPRNLRLALAQISRTIDRAALDVRIDRRDVQRAKRVFRLAGDLAVCAEADLIIEAVPDDLDAKQTVLRALDRIVRPNTILASSTNLHPVTALAAGTRLPNRVIGLHFFRPAHMSGVVEIVQTPHTRQELVDELVDLVRSIDKLPLVVQDTPGLVVNRVAQAYFGEALSLLDDGNLDAATVDQLLEAAGFARGPFRQMDYLGVDRVFALMGALFEANFYATPYRPHPRLARMTQAGLTGAGSRRGGFYRDPDADKGAP